MTSRSEPLTAECRHSGFFVAECIQRGACPKHSNLQVTHAVMPDPDDRCADCGDRPGEHPGLWWQLGDAAIAPRVCGACADERRGEPAFAAPAMSNEAYHQLPSLSASGAKILLQEGGPAKYRWQMDNPQEPRDTFDFGTAVHTLVLGAGDPIKPLPFNAWTEKGAKAAKEKARADGYVPLKVADYWTALRAATEVKRHRQAAALFSEGVAEQTILFEIDGVPCRARPDWMRPGIVGDLKTTVDAAPTMDGFGKQAATYAYAVQEAFYRAAVRSLGEPDPMFVFVCVEKSPPYLVSVVTLDKDARDYGERQMRRALEIYRDCTESGIWPAYDDSTVHEISLPAWTYYRETDA